MYSVSERGERLEASLLPVASLQAASRRLYCAPSTPRCVCQHIIVHATLAYIVYVQYREDRFGN